MVFKDGNTNKNTRLHAHSKTLYKIIYAQQQYAAICNVCMHVCIRNCVATA